MDEAMLKSGQFPNVAILAGTDPKEVMREHRQVIPDGEKYELDTREKLEADIRAWHRDTPFATKPSVQTLLGWLDRQAAITRRECADERENLFTEAIATCTKKISKLEAERDALKEQINRFNASKSEEIAENGTSKGVINNFDVQNDTREKLEAYAETLLFEFGHYCATSREGLSDDVYVFMGDLTNLLDRQAAITERECMSRDTSERVGWDCAECAEGLGKELDARCDKLKERIAELTAERDQLKADLKQANIEWESERDYANQCEERVKELTAELDACRMRERAAEDYDFREAAERWEQAYEDKCGEVVRLTEERDQLDRDLTAEHALVVQFEYDNEKLRDKNSRQRRQLSELQDAIRDRNQGVLKRQWKRQVDELTAERDQHSRGWAKANMGWAEANAEAEQWRQKCDQLRAELKTANDTINTLRASVAGLKETVEKLGAK